ncbi:hypothetical protein BDP27DRAFT_1326244 [Rhodocollybia butyracea]|uniref:BTB domain-containing protein n=1 Tax=Rhodocollybia butyracea TaxID=206335 RepID=A0A9P5U7L8_9AGAR|nr:hypothetical protein BDP27DRAFT_1347279 [Rhodocollybia butyracea]KAF9068987.1 hypothetical protein BDP27DRAFT_1326244 [Rhodocollybia butyracea]
MGSMATNCGVSESCLLPVDVILQSSDGKQFGAHSKNLELYSDAFPVAGSTIPPDGDIVKLTESAQIIQLMLCFTHNMPPPDLSSLDIQTLFVFGETVNLKYSMHYASECVSKEVNKRAITHPSPLEILAYKTKVSDLFMIDDLARRTMDIPIENVVAVLVNAETFRTWVRYREKWQSLMLAESTALNQRRGFRGAGSSSNRPWTSSVALYSQLLASKQSEEGDQLPLWKDFL